MSTLFSLIFSKLGLYVGLALALFIAGFVICWKWEHRHENKTYTQTVSVASVANGATLEAKAGLLGRSTRPVFVAGIAAPGLNDPLGPESRDNLASLAGDTIRVVSESRDLLGRPLVGQVFGDSGADLGLAQLRAGLAKCESGATKDQIAAQKEAQKAQRGLWATSGGSHWWHFGAAAKNFPEAIPLEPETKTPMFETIGLILEICVAAIVALWILWYFLGGMITSKVSAASAVTAAVDTSEQLACYAALTLIRYSPMVAGNTAAVASCESLRTVVTGWKDPAATPAKT